MRNLIGGNRPMPEHPYSASARWPYSPRESPRASSYKLMNPNRLARPGSPFWQGGSSASNDRELSTSLIPVAPTSNGDSKKVTMVLPAPTACCFATDTDEHEYQNLGPQTSPTEMPEHQASEVSMDLDSDFSSDEEYPASVHEDEMSSLSDSKKFQYAVGIVIMLNTVVIALEAAFIQEKWARPVFAKVELLFTIIYVLELWVKLREYGWRRFFTGQDWPFNVFDLLITATGVMDAAMGFINGPNGHGSGASAGRLFRILRILRLLRTLRFLKEVDYVIATAGKATLKLSLLVVLVVFISAIVVTNMLWDSPDPEVAEEFGDLSSSMWTMFKLMTLDNWIYTIDKVLKLRPGMIVFFVMFIFCASIALMSLVPAIFIELNMESKKRHADHVRVKEHAELRKKWKVMLKKLFRKADTDKSGYVSLEEMAATLDDERKLRRLQRDKVIDEGDFAHVKLGLFELWEEQVLEHGDIHGTEFPGLAEEPFINGIFKHRLDVSNADIWRSITAVRVAVHDNWSNTLKAFQANQHETHDLRECFQDFLHCWEAERAKRSEEVNGAEKAQRATEAAASDAKANQLEMHELTQRLQQLVHSSEAQLGTEREQAKVAEAALTAAKEELLKSQISCRALDVEKAVIAARSAELEIELQAARREIILEKEIQELKLAACLREASATASDGPLVLRACERTPASSSKERSPERTAFVVDALLPRARSSPPSRHREPQTPVVALS